MSSVREQRRRIDDARDFGQRLIERELATWTQNVTAEWTPGSSAIPDGAEMELDVILRRTYDRTANRLLGADYRLYKQEDEPDPFDEAMRTIATTIAILFGDRILSAAASILDTLRTMMRRASESAFSDEDLTPDQRSRAARMDLGNRMRSHRIIIAVTESNWTVNTTHRTAILAVRDPLGNSVERIAALFEAGDTAGARRLARRVLRLARLPSSVRQGELLGTISDFRDRLVTPEAQGRMVATMRSQASRLGAQEKRWEAVFRNTRPAHAEAHGQVKPADGPFEVGGYLMQAPMDGSLGAPLSQIVNCFPPWQTVATSPVAVMRRKYTGKLISIETVNGHKITVTPNHPVLGESGWIAAHLVEHGDSIACGVVGDDISVCTDVERGVPTAEQIYNTLQSSGRMMRYSHLAVNLHGERPNSDVDVVYADRKLLDRVMFDDPFRELGLVASDLAFAVLSGQREMTSLFTGKTSIADSLVSRLSVGLALGSGKLGHPKSLSFSPVSLSDSAAVEGVDDRTPGVSKLFGNSENRRHVVRQVADNGLLSARIAFEPIKRISVDFYTGFVYNIHDEKSYMVGNGIVNHNCQCRTVWL